MSIKVLFPLPETPVMQENNPKGKLASTFFKLFSEAPVNFNQPLLGSTLFFGTSTFSSFFKYLAVRVFDFKSLLTDPEKTTFPPIFPAKGPISIT